jgi:hypothetical protein
MLSLFVIAGFAKANDYFNRPWQLAALYVIVMVPIELIFGGAPLSHVLLSTIVLFGLLGLFFQLLYRFQDTIFTWAFFLVVGILVIGFITKFLIGQWGVI